MTKWLDAGTLVTDGHVLRVDAGDPLGLGRAGGYEPFETQILESLAGEASTVIEAGAGGGWHTLRLARAVGSRGRVVVFEPHASAVRLLEHNLRINAYRNVTVVPHALAVASAAGVIALDDWLGEHGGRIALIKLDGEAAAAQALDGMRRTLGQHPEAWLAATFSPGGLRRAGSSPREYLDRLGALGGVIVRVDRDHGRLLPLDERWLASADAASPDTDITLLAVPRGWPELSGWPLSARAHNSRSSTDPMTDRPSSASARLCVLLIAPAPAHAAATDLSAAGLQPLRDALAKHGVDTDVATGPVDTDGYDLIHFFNTCGHDELERQLTGASARDCPRVLTPFASTASSSAGHEAIRGLASLAHHLVVFSERELLELHRANALAVPYSLVHYGVDPNWSRMVDGEAFVSASGLSAYALCAGMTSSRAMQLERALAGTGIELVLIAGSGEGERGEAARMLAAAGSRVRILEGGDDALVASAFAGARVFVDANDGVAPPAAALRAAAAGLPMVLHERSCAREYFGALAFYGDTSSDDAVCERLLAVWHRETDDERGARREAARVWIERALTWEHAARELATAYARVLETRAAGGRSSFAAPAPRKLEIGSGNTPQRGYEHLDARADLPDIDHVADTREALPFPDGTFDELLSRSCIEHVSWREVQRVVREWGRIVKPGGIIDIWTPDFEYLCRRYLTRKDDRHLDPSLVADAGAFLGGYDDPAWAIIKMFGGQDYPENFHGAVLDEEVLTRVLEGAGFENVERHEPYWGLHLKARRAPAFAQVVVAGAAERSPREEQTAQSVVWDAPLFNFGGYAALTRHTVRALVQDGVPVQVTTRDDDEDMREESLASRESWVWKRALRRRGRASVHVSCYTPTSAQGDRVFEQRRAENPGFAAYVGLSMFETDRLPDGWREACASLDEVWVPSTHSRDLFEQAGIPGQRLHVLPVGIDADRYDPAHVEPLQIPGRRGFMFLSVFDWTPRKGWDVLIEAYGRAFRASDDVCLVLRTASRSVTDWPEDGIDAVFERLGIPFDERPTVILLDIPVPEDDMPRLYRAADAFVLPTRGEGWGLPLMEAMASGLPAIATAWGGHLDFMNVANSWLIDVERLAPVPDQQAGRGAFYAGGHRWAEPSVSSTSRLMRLAFDDRDRARRLGQAAREDIRNSWSPRRTAAWIAARVARYASGPAVMMEKARAAESGGRIEEALRYYAEAGRHKGWYLPRYNRASLLKRQNRRTAAERMFRELTGSADQTLQAGSFFHLGELAFLDGRLDEAHESFGACLEREPRHAAALAWRAFTTGRLHERAGDFADAERRYTEACTLKPDWPLAAYNLASACRRLGQIERARQLFGEVAERAAEPSQRGGSHFHLAQLAEADGRIADAVAHLDACVRDLPAHGRAGAMRESLLARQR